MAERQLFDAEKIEQYYRGFYLAKERKAGLAGNVFPVFYGSIPYRGEECETFAYLALPEKGEGGKVPGVVLVHGGNGKAEHVWASAWAERGFAAIAIDINAQKYADGQDAALNAAGGPVGYGSFDQMNEKTEDTWSYHSAASAVLARKLLAGLDFVDAAKIGIAGISWGGYVSFLAAGNCDQFAFCSVSYTSAYLYRDEFWKKEGLSAEKMGEKNFAAWAERLDPSLCIPNIAAPTLLIRGADDVCFDQRLWTETVGLFKDPPVLSLYPSLVHDQQSGAERPEIFAFAKAAVKGEDVSAARIGAVTVREGEIRAKVRSSGIGKAILVYTKSVGSAYRWKWEEQGAAICGDSVSVKIPQGATHWYLLVVDKDGNRWSGNVADAASDV